MTLYTLLTEEFQIHPTLATAIQKRYYSLRGKEGMAKRWGGTDEKRERIEKKIKKISEQLLTL